MSKNFIPLFDARELPIEGMRKVDIEGLEPVLVCNIGGKFYATQDTCSHAYASLADGWLEAYQVFCPVHLASFDMRDGQPKCFPATEPLRVFPTVIEDGVVCVDLNNAQKL